ncbi:hypothetical protein M3J09_012233 [Ascochyta lentis]
MMLEQSRITCKQQHAPLFVLTRAHTGRKSTLQVSIANELRQQALGDTAVNRCATVWHILLARTQGLRYSSRECVNAAHFGIWM